MLNIVPVEKPKEPEPDKEDADKKESKLPPSPRAGPKPKDCGSNLELDTMQKYEELKDRELLNGGLTKKDWNIMKKLEKILKQHREDTLEDHLTVPRREKEREILQEQINLKMQQIENIKNETWRELKLDLLRTEIGELVAEKNNYHISERKPGVVLDG